MKVNWDFLGAGVSIACAIHCAILPLLITSLPLFGLDILHNKLFEYSMIVLAFIVGVTALYHGYTKHHKKKAPILVLSIGFTFLVLKEVFVQYELLFLALAVTGILFAHCLNFLLCKTHKHQHVFSSHCEDQPMDAVKMNSDENDI
ncbi:MAG: MerC domain-containing protein [Phycisphaerales bacterium]|nr:MerC domain-containing protein [Phycisphaerales bacterium]